MFSDTIENNFRMFSMNQREKSSDWAQKFRQDGNRLYTSGRDKKDYEKAYTYYAQSVAHAPSNSQEMALAYANLSAVLLKLEKYSECLQAIDCCVSSGYPEQSKFKISLRKIECLKVLDKPLKAKRAYIETIVWIAKNQLEEKQNAKFKNELENCYKRQVVVKKSFTEEEVDDILQDFSIKTFNEEIPRASSAIRLKYSESMGRHFVATRDIRPGEILVKDRPFAIACSESCRYICCWKCCEPFANCIPCDCCNNVIFCSRKCKEEAWKEYHEEECKLLSFIFNTTGNDEHVSDVILAVRILIRAIKEYGTFDKLKEAVREMDLPCSDPRTNGFTNGQLLSDKYRAFWSLTGHPVHSHVPSTATGIVKLIDERCSTLFGKKLGTNSQDFNLVADWIARYLNIFNANSFEITKCDPSIYAGLCVFLVGSFFNHSCVANARCLTTKLKNEAYAILPIKKGEQVCINYLQGQSHTPSSLEKQQKLLENTFCFICKCVACKNNWPSFEEYPLLKESKIKSKIRAFFTKTGPYTGTMNIKSQMGNKYLKTKLSQLSGLLEELVANVAQPCQEIIFLQIELMTLFNKVHEGMLKSGCPAELEFQIKGLSQVFQGLKM